MTAVDLHWIPLGAGGRSVRFNGKVYEALASSLQHRASCDIYHSALEIVLAGRRYTVEMTPVPDPRGAQRGVVAEGPVGARWCSALRIFRYEVRRWRDGVIPDLGYAVGTPTRVTDDADVAQRVFDALPFVPRAVWGCDELHGGEMWTCNSIISWALTRAGIDAATIALPDHGRAPGWDAGITVALRSRASDVHRGAGAAGTGATVPTGPPRHLSSEDA